MRDGKAFSVTLHLSGIDSEIVTAFIKEGTAGRQFWYDSSIEGGPACAASVRVRVCGAITLRDDQELLECGRPKEWTSLCSQFHSRVEVLDVGGSVAELVCSEISRPEFECFAKGKAPFDGGVVPPVEGPDLLCAIDGPVLECQAESEWPEKAPY